MSIDTAASPTGRAHRVPRDPAFDSTLSLLREGYEFIGNRCRALSTDIFVTRLLGNATARQTGGVPAGATRGGGVLR
jgi:fatty-acid peroxygenase